MGKPLGFRALLAYQKAYKLAMDIFEISKSFPKEEKYSLTDQIRRSSRSVCANIAEGYQKRLYPKHFKAKLSDADMESAETSVWINFAHDCQYISKEKEENLLEQSFEVSKLLNYMLRNIQKFS